MRQRSHATQFHAVCDGRHACMLQHPLIDKCGNLEAKIKGGTAEFGPLSRYPAINMPLYIMYI